MPNSTNDPNAEIRAFHSRVMPEIVSWVEQRTIPFFNLRRNPATNEYETLEKDRSGVFLRIDNDLFILTAAHFIHGGGRVDYIDDEIYLCMSWDDEEKIPIPITSDPIALTPADTYDIAVIKLIPETAAKLLKRHKPLTLGEIDRDCRNAEGQFLILGFPRAGYEFVEQHVFDPDPHQPITEPFRYLGMRRYDGWNGEGLKYSGDIHLVLDVPTASVGATGDLTELPVHEGIQGISGCGIWLIADKRKNKPLSAYGAEDCQLVAIEHTYDDKAGRMAGTWIDTALAIIVKNFPETKAAIRLVYP